MCAPRLVDARYTNIKEAELTFRPTGAHKCLWNPIPLQGLTNVYNIIICEPFGIFHLYSRLLLCEVESGASENFSSHP